MLTIDGSQGEGGGQVVRTALALAILTATPVRIDRIRAKRKRPGLQRQHLTSVEAAARVGSARVVGAALDSMRVDFFPGPLAPGDHFLDVGTAGSTTLVLQTVLPPLLFASGPSRLRIRGGTHNPLAPPFDFLASTFLPLLRRFGARASVTLLNRGFYPRGGGEIEAIVEPATLGRIELPEADPVRSVRARAVVCVLARSIAERELAVLRERLTLDSAEVVEAPGGPGNYVVIECERGSLTETFTAIGERGKRAETVAEEAAREAEAYLAHDAPVGPHLADQLLVPLALVGGSFVTGPPTLHFETNVATIQRFLDVDARLDPLANGRVRVTLDRRQ